MTLPVRDEGSETGDPENEPAHIRRTGYFLSGRYPGVQSVAKKLSILALSKQSPVPQGVSRLYLLIITAQNKSALILCFISHIDFRQPIYKFRPLSFLRLRGIVFVSS